MENVADYYPLSPMQQGMLVHALQNRSAGAYTEITTCVLAGEVDPGAIRRAWESVVARHAPLRTAFLWEGLDEWVQVVRQTVTLPWQELDWQGLDPARQEAELARLVEEERTRGFDVTQAPLMRLTFIRTGWGEGRLIWAHHHALFDGWSLPILLRDFFACHAGERASLPPAPPYREYIDWIGRSDPDSAADFWRDYLGEFTEPTPLGRVSPRRRGSPPPERVGERLFALDLAATERLCGFARASRVTPNTLVQAAWACALGRAAGVRDVVFGATVSGRPAELPEAGDTVGLFINTLPVRIDACSTRPLAGWLAEIQAAQVRAEAFGYCALSDIQAWSEVPASAPLFDSLCVFENYPVADAAHQGSSRLSVREPRGYERTNYPLNLVAALVDGRLAGKLLYDEETFTPEAIAAWVWRVQAALADLPAVRCAADLALLSTSERAAVVVRGNQTGADYPRGARIEEVFAARVAEMPEAIALQQGEQRWSYRELDAAADALARQLRQAGVVPGDVVGVALARSLELVAGLLAILKCGAAYLPLDAAYPEERLAFMRRAGGVRRILTRLDGRVAVRTVEEAASARPAHGLAYILFTSGSTGEPKAVAVPHRAVMRLVRETNYAAFGPTETFLQLAPVSFDASTFEIWGALLNGGRLVLMPPGEPTLLETGNVIRDQGVTTLWLTAGLFNVMITERPGDLRGLRQLLVGGEALSVPHVRRALELLPATRLTNGYGPTESTTFACCHGIQHADTEEKSVPIGRPISNTTAYLLGPNGQPVPPGAVGELFLGGDGLAVGYWNSPALTAEKFVPDPFSAASGARLYRTGDLGRFLPDGAIEFLGRRDHQVKVRGFRVELGEVEAALRAEPGVRDAAVTLREEGTGRRLVAYLAPAAGARLDPAALRAAAARRLPPHAVPSAWVVLPTLPLNAVGKVDRAALPAPLDEGAGDEAPPESPDEQLLAGIWAHVLRQERIGRHDNFFARGGHSLLATQLTWRVWDAFEIAVPLKLLFEHPTLAEFAAALRGSRTGENVPPAPLLTPTPRAGEIPLSFAQERLWFLHQLEPENPFYNIPHVLRLEGALDVEAFRRALARLLDRHEALRTGFRSVEGRPVQVIAADAQPPLPVVDLTTLPAPEQEREVARLAEADARQPFDLARDLLLRAQLLRLGPEAHILLLSLHHIVSDGWSTGVLTRDLSEFYDAECAGRTPDLPALPIQYADFAAWQRQWLTGDTLRRQLDYWQGQLAGAPPSLPLPTDRPRPAVQSYRGRIETFEIEADLAADLRRLSNELGATLFMTLLAGFAVLLSRYSDQRDLVIGSPIANRTRSELAPLIGFFVNTLALRFRLEAGATLREVVAQTRRDALDAYAHQDLPFERLVDELQAERDLSRNPLFQVMFALQNAPVEARRPERLHIRPVEVEAVSAQFDLVLDVWETEGGLTCVLEYSTDLFDLETARRLLRHYRNLLVAMVAEPDETVGSVRFIDAAERRQLLDGFNPVQRDYPVDRTIHALFEEVAACEPGRVAIVDHRASLTYGELNARANRVAHRLRGQGVGRGDFVGILEERGGDFLAAMLGVLKAGGAFLPLDPAYPSERLQHMVEDSGLAVLITRGAPAGLVPWVQAVLDLDEELALFPTDNPPNVGTGQDVAYLLYTSGTTGLPKGALVRHDGAVNHVFAEFELLSFTRDSAFLQSAPCSSDISVWQFLAPVLIGGRVVVADYETVCDPARLFERIGAQGVTLIELVPVVLGALLEHARTLPVDARALPALRCAMVTGEAVSAALINLWLQQYPDVPLVNAYGPTEAADDVCQRAFTAPLPPETRAVPIGTPLPNVWLYVLDRELALVPVGVPGEICVSGVAVGDGYWHAPEQTTKSFPPNPYAGQGRGRTLYRTGDLGRWLPDGQIEYLGRFDDQVKLRGFRIELGEIENVLAQHPAVGEAVVVTREGAAGEKFLAAYVTPRVERGGPTADAALEDSQIALWTELHDNSYDAEAAADPTFNCLGWDSNYTGQPLPEVDMREYVATAVERILSLQPRRLLEIGCGTGLLMFPLLPRCGDYLGVDVSATAIGQLRRLQASPALQARVPGLGRARLACGRADDLPALEEEKFDVAILPSVVQYFPSLEYLDRVLRGLVARLAPGGGIFVGDVRNLQLLEAFHASVAFFKAAPGLLAGELRRRIARSVAQEQELCVHPDYFRALAGRVPGVASVEILPKPGRCLNEMTRFRYDVLIRLGVPAAAPAPEAGEAWRGARWPDGVFPPPAGGWRGVPNARVHEPLAVIDWLAGADEAATVADLRAVLATSVQDGVDPQEIWDFAAARDEATTVRLSATGTPGSLDVCPGTAGATAPQASTGAPRPWNEQSNHPLLEKFAREHVPAFRAFLKSRLPGHMVPADFVVLEHLPLTPAGKVDRQNLPAPPSTATAQRGANEAPETEPERRLAAVWGAVLGVEGIGRHDNFFELGGHSLKAMQVISRIEKEAGLTISLREMFNRPTLAEFAPLLAGGAPVAARFIPRVPEQESYAVSHAQRRLWVLHRMDPAATAYNMPAAATLDGPLDRAAFEQALAWIVERHESLRTVIASVGGEPWQTVRPFAGVVLDFRDLRNEPSPDERARHLAVEAAHRPFDLERGPLFRLLLLRVADARHVFVSTLHHVISDDWSGGVLIRELAEAYAATCERRSWGKAPLRVHYRDYSAWQNTLLAEAATPDRDYWHRQLAGDLPTLDLPFARVRPTVKTFVGDTVRFGWERGFTRRLTEFGQGRGAGLYATLLAAVAVLLHRYSGRRDLILGSPVAGRHHADLEDQIGFYVNTLALRSRLTPDQTFADFLRATMEAVTAALDHQVYPFDRLVNELNLRRDVSRSPLFDVMVVLQQTAASPAALGSLKIGPFPFEAHTSQFDLTFSFEVRQESLHGEITFNTDLFDRVAIERMTCHLRTLVEGFLDAPETRLDRLPLLSAAERAAALRQPAPGGQTEPLETIVARFERQAHAAPGAVAICAEGQTLSYRELNTWGDRIARQLAARGVRRGDRVGLLVPRSVGMVAAILGILKTGAAYVPFDPEYPPERRAFMAADAGLSAVVTHPEVGGAEEWSGLPHVDLSESMDLDSEEAFASAPRPADVAYIIYTSGSTGQPKGVPVTHANVVRLFDRCQPWYHFGTDDVWTLFHSVAFDFSVWELWGALLYGGRLVVVPYWTSRSPAEFLILLETQGVTVLNQTPSAFQQLAQADAGRGERPAALALRYVIFGGEALDLPGLLPWCQRRGDRHPRLVNMYGITETTVHVTYRPLAMADFHQNTSVIGVPIDDLQLYLLDSYLEPVPPGVPGEICVGGAGVAQGYLNRPGLTAERFVPDPFGPGPGGRLYRSGDLARRLENGDLEYLGRLDEQVKIRGFRIEMGEIAAHLAAHPRLQHAAVVPVRQAGETRLAAYVVALPDARPPTAELRAFLRARVPEYMLPGSFTFLDALPLTPHGKLDRRALPAPTGLRVEPTHPPTEPRTGAERTIAAVWAELLGVERVGVTDNIFDLGAHSLLLIRAQELLRERGGWELAVLDLFRCPTVSSLARHVSGAAADGAGALEAADAHADERREARRRRAATTAGRTER